MLKDPVFVIVLCPFWNCCSVSLLVVLCLYAVVLHLFVVVLCPFVIIICSLVVVS